MLDDDYAEYNAVRAVYGNDVFILLCNWHVKKNWVIKVNAVIKEGDDRKKILDDLDELLKAKDVEKFCDLISDFRKRIKKFPGLLDYFDTYYFSPERILRWSECYWDFPHNETRDNMFIESFHHVFKGKFLERRSKKRLDDLLEVWAEIDLDYNRKRCQPSIDKINADRILRQKVQIEKRLGENGNQDLSERNPFENFFFDPREECQYENVQLEKRIQENQNKDMVKNKVSNEPKFSGPPESDHKSRRKWQKILEHYKYLEEFFFDPEVEIILDHIEGIGNGT